MKAIYMDYASTTFVDEAVQKVMEPYFSQEYGNPSSFHMLGFTARDAVADARSTVAGLLHCKDQELIFTGSGTESINLALKGVAFAQQKQGNHIVTSSIEHHAVLETCKYLEKHGFEVTYVKPNSKGIVEVEQIEKAIRPTTILISLMYVNNEIGTIQPIEQVGTLAQRKHILFHTDACQAAGYLDLDVQRLHVDLMSLNGSKIYGPKGVGVLYKKIGVAVEPLIHGGGQEFGLRSGTEHVAGIVGFAKALEIAQLLKERETQRLTSLRDYCIRRIVHEIPGSVLNGDQEQRIPNNVNVSFEGLEAQPLLMELNAVGIAASTGSACASQNDDPSHVILSVTKSAARAKSSLRLTFGRGTTQQDVDYVIEQLKKIVQKLGRKEIVAEVN